jgi:hypothetical protein
MSLGDFIRWDSVLPQTGLLGKVNLDDLTLVGLAEKFDQSINLFNATFETTLSDNHYAKMNPNRPDSGHAISADIR